MKLILTLAVLTATACGQSTYVGTSTTAGLATWSAPNNTTSASVAQLPQNWVNQHQCDAALNNPDVLKRVRNTGGDYAGTQTGLQQALNDAEALRVAQDQSTKIVIDTDVTITVSNSGTSLTMPNSGYAGNACVVIASSNPLRRTIQVGTIAIQSILRSSGTVTVNTYDSHGLTTGDTALIENVTGWQKNFNGTFTVTVISSTQFSYQQTGFPNETGTATFPFTRVTGPNTLAQQAVANFYRIVVAGNNAAAIQGAAGSHHWAWFDADITTTAAQNDTPLVLLGNTSDNTGGYAGQGFHMGIDQYYVHGCAGSVPTTTPIWPEPIPCATETKVKNAIRWLCGDCWIMNGMTDQIVYQGVETHSAGTYTGQGPAKMVNNHFRSGSTTIHFGGTQPTITGLIPTDVEIRLNTIELDPNWYGLSACGLSGGRQWNLKNRIEIKNGTRFLVAGNRVNYSWCDGQIGSLMLLTVRGDGYWDQSSHVTLEDNLFQHGHDWLQLMGRDDSASGAGLSMHGSNYLIRNNLVTDIANLQWAISAGVSKAVPLTGTGQNYSCNASRSGNVATLSSCVCTSDSCPYTGIGPGDYIHTTACSDASFNTSRSVTAIASDPFTTGPITFANPGPNTSSVTCTINNMQGWPQYVYVDHNTIIAANEGGSIRNLLANTAITGSDPDLNVARNITYKNTLMAKTGGSSNWFYCSANSQEGTASNKAAACVDRPTFSFHHLGLFGPSAASSNYSEWNPAGTELTSLSTVHLLSSAVCSSTPNQNCAGFVNNFSTTSDSDYHNYGLLSTSYYKAGQPGQADDGKDMGVDLSEMDTAFVQGQYVCRTSCGMGPYGQ